MKKIYMLSMAIIDATIVAVTSFLALWIRFDGQRMAYYENLTWQHLIFVMGAAVSCLFLLKLYHRLWRYASIGEVVSIGAAVTLFSSLIFIYDVWRQSLLPISVYVLFFLLSILLIGMSRFVLRLYMRFRRRQAGHCSRVLIVGAGDAGVMIAREIRNSYFNEKRLIGFVDDDPDKVNGALLGVKILGNSAKLPVLVGQHRIDEIIIAMPSAGGSVIKHIMRVCQPLRCTVKTLPGMYELIDGKVTVRQLRDVAVEDLLRRDPVRLENEKIMHCLRGRRVLITGAGGSIGSELCRQVLRASPSALYLLGRGENSIYEIESELRLYADDAIKIVSVIADIRDKARLKNVFEELRPEVVFHAAAHKHVPLMERQPIEAVRNNIFGTKNVAEVANFTGVDRFVMISTDKAVNPTSVMGASKRAAEMIIQNMNRNSRTRFTTVRFGNVLGSRGSVLPLFQKQIARGGPITITHSEMKRYFMTIPEAAQLVLQAGAMAEGGEVFVLDMGAPVKIYDLACDLIALSGLKAEEDIKIEFTGLRPGEKLYEELLTPEEGTRATRHDKIFCANLKNVDETQLYAFLTKVKGIDNGLKIIELLENFIPTYFSKQLQMAKDVGKKAQ